MFSLRADADGNLETPVSIDAKTSSFFVAKPRTISDVFSLFVKVHMTVSPFEHTFNGVVFTGSTGPSES